MAFTDIYVDPSKQTRTAVTITNSTTTATVTQNGHGYSNSDTVKIQGATEDAYNGNFVISNVTTNTYDYTMGSDPGGSATGSPLASKLNLSGDDGTTSALAWADLQYALDQTTRSTSGDRFNIKAGTSEVLNGTLSTTEYESGVGIPTQNGPLLFQGYTTTSQDQGKATISGDSRYSVWFSTSRDYINFLDLRLIDSGSATVLQFDDGCSVIRCEISGTTGDLINSDNYFLLSQCYLANGQRVYLGGAQCQMEWCFVSGLTTGIYCWYTKIRNCFFFECGNAIELVNLQGEIATNNSLLNTDNTGTGVTCDTPNFSPTQVVNNIVEGFSKGFDWTSGGTRYVYFKYNAAYNNTTNYDTVDGTVIDAQTDNEVLTASAFKKTGSLPTDFTSPNFWSDVYAYFEPVDIGNVLNGFPEGSNTVKGALGKPETFTYSLHPLAYN